MAAVGDDCYFFCTSSCAKGAACPFRHVESAKTNKIICQHWQTTGCFRPMCKFRHSDFHIQVNFSEIPCYWESQPVGCSKANCAYKHSKPRPGLSPTATQGNPKSPDQKEDVKKDGEVKDIVDQFVMPTVKPVIIDPESEASNSSPVKKPPPKDAAEETSDLGMEAQTEKESSSEKDNEDTKGKGAVGKKTATMAGKKKKVAGSPLQKNGKLGTAKKGVKKVKKAVNGSPAAAAKTPVKRKKVDSAESVKAKPDVPAKKQVKERLGIPKKKEEPSNKDQSSSSDSDDSIENVKVLSMEEIFRQKALESMMKKRAAEGKPMMPNYGSAEKEPAVVRPQPSKPNLDNRMRRDRSAITGNRLAGDNRPAAMTVNRLKKDRPTITGNRRADDNRTAALTVNRLKRDRPPVIDARPKKQMVVKKKAPLPPPPPPESDDEEEEEDESKEDFEDDDDDDSSSSESSSDSSESEDNEVRRVVINLDAEKAAREKAKASLAKRRHVESSTVGNKTLKRRKVIQQEPLSTTFSRSAASSVHQRLSVKERLGKPITSGSVASSVVTSREVTRKVSSSSSSEDDEEEEVESSRKVEAQLSSVDVKVKSVENIQQEKLGGSPIKDRLGLIKVSDEEDDEQEEKTGRQILLTDDVAITDVVASPKKARKRPWSSSSRQKKNTEIAEQDVQGEEDQRTVSATSPVEKEPVPTLSMDEPESPFESLRRRALLKKTQQLEGTAIISEAKDDESEDNKKDAEEEEEAGGKRKKHKHKHKHKKHKKSKSERQIYVPPAKKSVITEVLERVKKSLLPQRDDLPPAYEEESVVDKPLSTTTSKATTTVQQPRSKPRAAAMWAAGLSVSSKGLGGRPLLPMDTETHEDDTNLHVPSRQKSSFANSKMSSSIQDSSSSVPVVKTFSQIMAEKRQKRQATQESGVSIVDDNSSSPSRMQSKLDSARPRVPITPIRFDLEGESKSKSKNTSILNRGSPSHSHSLSPPPSSLFSSRTTASVTAKSHASPIRQEKISTTTSSINSSSSSALSLSDIRPTYKTARAKKLFNKKGAAAPTTAVKAQSDSSSPISLSSTDSPTHISSSTSSLLLMDETAQSSSSRHRHHHHHQSHRKSMEISSAPLPPAPSGDAAAVALKSPAASDEKKPTRRASTASESHRNQSTSLDDEFSFFDGGEDIEDIGDIVGKDVEPIDDLLQDIDDLLA